MERASECLRWFADTFATLTHHTPHSTPQCWKKWSPHHPPGERFLAAKSEGPPNVFLLKYDWNTDITIEILYIEIKLKILLKYDWNTWKILERYLKDTWKILERYLKDTWNTLGMNFNCEGYTSRTLDWPQGKVFRRALKSKLLWASRSATKFEFMTITTVLTVASMDVPTRPSNCHASNWSNCWRQPNIKTLWNARAANFNPFPAIRQMLLLPSKRIPNRASSQIARATWTSTAARQSSSRTSSTVDTKQRYKTCAKPNLFATKPGPFPIRITCVESVSQLLWEHSGNRS